MFRKLITACLILANFSLFSQTSQSPLSRSGIGFIETAPLLTGKQFGGALSAVRSSSHINIANPASYSAVDSMSFITEFGVTYHINSVAQDGEAATYNNASFDYLAMMFPVTRWWAGSIAILPASSSEYNVQYESSDDYNEMTQAYIGHGGLRKANWGNSVSFLDKSLSVGANLAYVWGYSSYQGILQFDGGVSNRPIKKENEYRVSGLQAELGLQYEKELFDNKKAIFGLSYTPAVDFSYDATETISEKVYDYYVTIDGGVREGLTTTVPAKLSVGAGYGSSKFMVYADYFTQDWSGVSVYGKEEALNKHTQVSLATEFSGFSKKIKPSFRRVKYRLGMFLADTYSSVYDVNGTPEQLRDLGMTFGIGLPMFQSRNNINFACKIGQRSSGGNASLEERYIQLHFNMTLHEKWFFKRKFD